jgi:hypothetical protein
MTKVWYISFYVDKSYWGKNSMGISNKVSGRSVNIINFHPAAPYSRLKQQGTHKFILID